MSAVDDAIKRSPILYMMFTTAPPHPTPAHPLRRSSPAWRGVCYNGVHHICPLPLTFAMPDIPSHLPDYYGALEVKPVASDAVIRWAYRRAGIKLSRSSALGHPDAKERMELVNTAYQVLIDPERRAEYDAQLRGVR